MLLNTRRLLPLPAGEHAPVLNGTVWRSLAVNPYALFERESLRQLLFALCERELQTDEAYVPIVNLRLEVVGNHSCVPALSGAVVLGAPQLATGGESVALVTLTLVVDRRALLARQLRTRELPLGSAALVGFAPITRLGRDDRPAQEMPARWTAEQTRQAIATRTLLEQNIAGGASLYEALQRGHPLELAYLLDTLAARQQPASPSTEDDSELVLSSDDSEQSRDDERSGDVDEDERVRQQYERRNVPQLDVPRCSELQHLRLIIEHGRYKLYAAKPRLYAPQRIVERSRRIECTVLSSNPLHRALFGDADTCTFYIGREADFDAVDAPMPASSPPPSPPTPAPSAVVEQPAPLTWVERFTSLDLADLTLYEMDTYARTRLVVLLLLGQLAATEPEAQRAEIASHWLLRTYPRRSGAQRHLLQALGERALARESMHETIAVAVLALVAKRNQQLRENFLLGELLLYRHRQSVVLRDDDDNDGDDDAEMERRCATIERFWQTSGDVFTSGDASLALLRSAFETLASEWTREMVQ